jgi:threonylcarbamoyladenosine tRNA methylthiotransferase MtaB
MKRTVAFETLGCKLNQYETDAIATELDRRGFAVVGRNGGTEPPGTGRPPDAWVINSCTVTNKADRKSRNLFNRAVRAESGVVVLTGCYVDSHREELTGSAATYVVDNAHKNTIPELLEAHFRGEVVDPDALDPDVFGFVTPDQIFHTRTNIKVQDGCDNFCTFCIIPQVRGRARSRPPQEVLAEAREAIRGGTRELVLTGVNMSRYRHPVSGIEKRVETRSPGRVDDPDGPFNKVVDTTAATAPELDFPGLVAMILDLPGDFRVRISSLEPDQLDDRFLALFDHPRMCPHLHLCLQSGSDRILLAMRRMYHVAHYLEIVEKLRARNPRFTITTDLIVGFPGETEREFADSCRALDKADVAHVHMFPYSIRSGTRAARMDGHLTPQEKSRRGRIVQEEGDARKRRIRAAQIGTTQRVLIESAHHDGDRWIATGLTEFYHPTRIASVSTALEANTFCDVTIGAIDGDGSDPVLLATPVL